MSDRFYPEYPSEITTEFLFREMQRISVELNAIRDGFLDVSYAEPDKPRQGDIRYADGTEWNPGGSGEGIYFFDSNETWVKL